MVTETDGKAGFWTLVWYVGLFCRQAPRTVKPIILE